MVSNSRHSLAFLASAPAVIVSAILLLQGVAFYRAPTAEFVPNPPPLSSLATQIQDYRMAQDIRLDPETQAFLKADDTVNRAYVGPTGPVMLFVAFFKSQRAGVTPHSPKICLPGAGWTPESATVINVAVNGESIPVNRYAVRHEEDRTLVLYWYATAHHTMAGEYRSKLYLMDEGVRHHRSDEALYRVIVPVDNRGDAVAEQTAVRFIESFYPPLKRQMWVD